MSGQDVLVFTFLLLLTCSQHPDRTLLVRALRTSNVRECLWSREKLPMGTENQGTLFLGRWRWGARSGDPWMDLCGLHNPLNDCRGDGKSEDAGELDFSGLLKKR